MFKDFLGNELKEGDSCIHVKGSNNSGYFTFTKIVGFKDKKISVLGKGNSRPGYTYGEKLIKLNIDE